MENHEIRLLPSAPKSFTTQYGEKVGDYFFAPLRKHAFTVEGVKRWYAPRLASRPQDGTGFAATNCGPRVTTYEGVAIPPNRTILVSHPFETMAARVSIPSPGTYFVVASFSPAGFEGDYVVSVCANGKRLWDERIPEAEHHPKYSGFVRVTSPAFIDFAINSEKNEQTVPCRTFVQYAVVQCNEGSGALQMRCDDSTADFSSSEIVASHSSTPFQPIEATAPNITLPERAALFEKEWTLPIEYIKSQYQRSPRELVEFILNNKEKSSTKYCIFMIPRSGSTLLTEILASTNELGFPSEYFVPDVLRTFSLAFSDIFASYEDFLISRLQSRNSVFGIEIESERFQEEPEFFSDVKNWRHVYIWRKDILAQAISYQISIETGVWHNFSGAPHQDGFRYIPRKSILEKVNFLLGVEKFFTNFFREHEISPYTLSYEELIANPGEHVPRIARHVGLDDANLLAIDVDQFILQPTAKPRNSYYKALAICGGGDLWGYDIHEANGQYLAVLQGVDLSLLDTAVERAPVLFVANDRQELCDIVHGYVTQHMSSLPPITGTPAIN